ncbi:hypothetical protein VTG60DRAFT_3973 [Thermothelomyces hinnuleus]
MSPSSLSVPHCWLSSDVDCTYKLASVSSLDVTVNFGSRWRSAARPVLPVFINEVLHTLISPTENPHFAAAPWEWRHYKIVPPFVATRTKSPFVAIPGVPTRREGEGKVRTEDGFVHEPAEVRVKPYELHRPRMSCPGCFAPICVESFASRLIKSSNDDL